MDNKTPIFTNIQEELRHYKNLAAEYQQKARITQQDLEEFQESSRELESELEAQLQQSEYRIKELRATNSRLQREYDSTLSKYDALTITSNRQITELQDSLSDERKAIDEMHKYIRELEQKNDDLERVNRATICSLEDFEARLNQAIERNAFLENELDEKDAMVSMVQRLKDEARDLKQELTVYQAQKGSPSTYHNSRIDKVDRKDSNTERSSEKDSPSYHMGCQNTPLTPSARISALNIVGDLLRRVGGSKSARRNSSSAAESNDSALESKLASCRNFSKEGTQKTEKEEPAVPVKTPTHAKARRRKTSSETKHMPRGSSLPVPKDRIPLIA